LSASISEEEIWERIAEIKKLERADFQISLAGQWRWPTNSRFLTTSVRCCRNWTRYEQMTRVERAGYLASRFGQSLRTKGLRWAIRRAWERIHRQ
jgi:hypothetical protein